MSDALGELPPCAECGHEATEHHVSWFPGGAVIVEECEDWNATPQCNCEHYRRVGR